MNLLLHGIGDEERESPIVVDDALKADHGERFEMVLTNAPFGCKSSMTFVSDAGLLVVVSLAFLGVAVAAEVLSVPISGAGEDWPHALEGAFEEGAELAGWISSLPRL